METTAADQQLRDLPNKQQQPHKNKQQQHNKQQRQQQHLNDRQQHQVDLLATATWATDSSVLRRMSSMSIQTIAKNISGLMIILLTFLKISSKTNMGIGVPQANNNKVDFKSLSYKQDWEL